MSGETAPEDGDTLSVDTEAIPKTLRERDNWVCFRLEPYTTDDGEEKTDKIPVNPRTGAKASTSNPETWASFETAVNAAETRDDLDGIGMCFADGDTLAAVDFDDVRHVDSETSDVTVSEWAGKAIRDLDSYTEVSPSGTGFHTWIFGFKPGDSCKTEVENGEDIEMYDHADNRFLTVTGDRCPESPEAVNQRSDVFGDLYRKYFAADETDEGETDLEAEHPGVAPEGSGSADLSDDEILRKAREAENGDLFTALWMGDTSGHDSHSEADLALCNLLAFWVGEDRNRIERLFRRSGLYRDKWQREDYRTRTIDKALSGRTETYEPASSPGTTDFDISDLSGSTDDRDGPTWRAVRDGLSDSSVPNGSAYQHGAELLLDSHPVLTERETGRTLAYDDETGIYHGHGKPILQRELVERLESEYLTARQREILARVTGLTETPMDEIGGPKGNICVANGVLDLADPTDPDLTEHDPEHGFRRAFAVEYDPEADCPQFREFLGEVVDPDDLDTLQEYAGYCLMHWGQPFKRACVLVGPRDAGKTTFTGVLTGVLGVDNVSAEPLDKLVNSRWGIARTYRKLLNAPDEMGTAALDDIPRFNSLLGGGRKITAERKREQKFDFEPTAKHIYAANDLPEIGGSIGPNTREAFFSRLLFIRFPESIPDSEQVRELGQELVETEGSGILNWMLEGYARLLDQDGFSRDPDPERKARTWERYGDSISQFKARRLRFTLDPNDWISKNKAYDQYVEFCQGEGVLAKEDEEFKRRMGNDDRVGVSRRDDPKTGMRPRVFIGVRRA